MPQKPIQETIGKVVIKYYQGTGIVYETSMNGKQLQRWKQKNSKKIQEAETKILEKI